MSSSLLTDDRNHMNGNGIVGTPTSTKITRTVAIIKHHALSHRFEVERRIQESSFEIVKERQMDFDIETDPDFLVELFGDDAASLGEGPVWVYVLERRRAVEVWLTLMGHPDPEVARQESPNSLRALYGISLAQNGIMGAPDVRTAEAQIASLFASSPPFPTSDLPDSRFNTLQSVNSSVLDSLRQVTSEDGDYPPSSNRSGGSNNGRSTSNGGRPSFKARGVPSTHSNPDIVPRTTKAAQLRANGPSVKDGRYTKTVAREGPDKARVAQTFANVPGHRRAETISVASTAAPTIAPRMTKAAALRLGIQPAASPVKRTPSAPTNGIKKPAESRPSTISRGSTFEGVPGHKRRETIAVASVQAPIVAPRTNRSAALRATKEAAPPSSFQFKAPAKTPGLTRSNSSSSLGPPRPSIVRPASAASLRPTVSRTSSVTPVNGTNGNAPAKPKPRPSSIAAPSIAPRTNKSAALRLAKKAEEEAAALAAAARKFGVGRPKPRASVAV